VAQPYFREGLLLLHQFRHGEAAEKFQMAQLLDPDMHMAYWGELMCYDQSIWFRHDLKKGQGVLFKLGISAEKRLEKINDPLEKALIGSAELLYDGEKDYRTRRTDYHRELERLGASFPDHAEVQCFLALSSLTMYAMTWDREFAQDALQVLDRVLQAHPTHPGALHYMLHAADHPNRAYKARGIVDRFLQVEDGYYARHLVSHHHLCTGQWGPLIETNARAWELAGGSAGERNIKIADIGYHIPWWQVYGLLQSGRFEEAGNIIKDIHFYSSYSKSSDILYHLIVMRAAFLLESERWTHPVAEYDIPIGSLDLVTKSVSAFADGMIALRNDNLQKAAWYVNKISDYRTLEQNDDTGLTAYHLCHGKRVTIPLEEPADRMLAEMLELSLRALLDQAQSDQNAAFEHIERAASLESRLPYFPAPPFTIRPVHELYGEMLLEIGKPVDALEKFDMALAKHPNRTRSVLGVYKALNQMGDMQKAAEFKAMLNSILLHADSPYPGFEQ
jgi:tetratricopeptide (TPR) repeat protein